MSLLPTEPVDAFDVFDCALKNYLGLLTQSFFLIILITLAQAFTFYLGHLFAKMYLNAIFELIGLLLFLYCSGAMLYQAQQLLEAKRCSVKDALYQMWGRCLPFFAGAILLVVIVALYYYLLTYVVQVWLQPIAAPHASLKNMLIFIFLCLAPILVFIVFMIFSLPLIIIDRLNPFKAFLRSYVLIGSRWIQAFTIYACLGIIYILVSPGTLHAHFFMHYHVFMIFVWISYCILLPFLFNYLLVMLHDFKLRLAAEVDFE